MKKRLLVLPTVVALQLLGCSPREIDRDSKVRNSYRSREDCLKDWNDPKDCQEDHEHRAYVGPWYPYYMYQQRWASGAYRGSTGVFSETTGAFHSAPAVGESVSISRGGFGSTGHGASAGE